MANPWFRLYSEFQDDPKIQMLSEQMQRRFVMLLCSRCKVESLTDQIVAFQWRMPLADVLTTKAVFVEAGFIDDEWIVIAWDKRQYVSDKSTERVRKFRSGETFQKRSPKQAYPVAGNIPEQNRSEEERLAGTDSEVVDFKW